MYTAFYELREKPFALSPDPRFLFLAQSHREALAHLLYGIDQGEGFIVITGEVGTGKTTLCRALLQRLEPSTEVAFLFNPSLTPRELLQAINIEFALGTTSRSKRELVDDLNAFLLEKHCDRRKVLLIVDEAQSLSEETLEEVRLLSNLETETSKLIQILLLGQPELDTKLASPELRQLRQRITVRWRLEPMTAAETGEYARHRLRVAAGGDRPIFTDRALGEVHRRTRGVPRIVNVLCDRALLAGYAAQAQQVSTIMIANAAREIAAAEVTRRVKPARRWHRLALGAGLALALLIVGGVALQRAGEPDVAFGAVPVEAPMLEAPPESRDPLGLAAPEVRFDSLQDEPDSPTRVASAERESRGEVAEIEAAPPLARLLGDGSRSINRSLSVDGMLSAFGFSPSAELAVDDALDALRAHGLDVLELPDATLADLRVLNHPAILRVHSADGEQRLVGLRKLDGEVTTLVGVSTTDPFEIPVAELQAHWEGGAYVVWRDFEALPRVLSLGASGRPVEWLQQALAELGHYEKSPTGRFDAETELAVMSFQSSHELRADGRVGPRTKMVLYDALDRYEIPRLVHTKDVG